MQRVLRRQRCSSARNEGEGVIRHALSVNRPRLNMELQTVEGLFHLACVALCDRSNLQAVKS